MDTFLQDLKFGVRNLRRSPGFTLAAVLALGIGIGANTSLFSVVNSVLLRPLPFPDSAQLVSIEGRHEREGSEKQGLSRPDFADVRAGNHSFTELGAYATSGVTLTQLGEPERLEAAFITSGFFTLLGEKPLLGRTFTSNEDPPEAAPTVVLSHGLWVRRFSADPGVLGRMIQVDGVAHEVVGVMPPDFDFPRQARVVQAWLPLSRNDLIRTNWDSRGAQLFEALGRLRPGVTLEQAQAELKALVARLEEEHPDTNEGRRVDVAGLQERLSEEGRRPLLLLLGAVAFVLLIACGNLANLLLARAAARHKEFAIRAALGAGGSRMVRQLLTESLLLSTLGGAVGLLMGLWGVDFLVALLPDSLRNVQAVQMDGRVFAFGAALSMLTGVLFGLAPALTAARARLSDALRQGRGTSASRTQQRVRGVLIAAEVAIALTLLVAAGLLVRSFWRLQSVDVGFQMDGVTTLRLALPKARYQDRAALTGLLSRVGERLRALPGAERVGFVFPEPFSTSTIGLSVEFPGRPESEKQSAHYRAADEGYFATLGIAVKRGRVFTPSDTATAPQVVVVNEAFVQRFFPHEEPLGQSIIIGYDEPVRRQIVGVVGNTRPYGLERAPEPEFYAPFVQTPWPAATIVVRSPLPKAVLAAAVRQEVWSEDSLLPVPEPTTLEELLALSMAGRRFQMSLLLVFAGAALVLAMLGVYGVIAYGVTQRYQELGVRLALGAQPGDVLRLVMAQGMRLCAMGLGVGLIAAFFIARLMESLLFEVGSSDPWTYGAIAALLAASAALASYLPARRATRVPLTTALRSD
ncbi:ABC transporter permease [Hyalangium versicolor]|uniref:ABC transporter permease n=1 Tax=Hyalangium versicolor TaxID=2861190 RepID=UPI001CCFF948|nr:ABC transporter permease [Hyalangium versicolor]